MAGLMKMMMDKNLAPGWFYLDRKKGLSDEEILEKIQLEIYNEAINRDYNLDLWTDAFIRKVSMLYFNHFQKLYEISIGARELPPLREKEAAATA